MYHNLVKSLAIGSALGIVIAVSRVDSSIVGMLVSLVACLIAGAVTVITISSRPNLYALPATLISGFLICLSYGLKVGLFYTLGVALTYGVISVQLLQAIGVSFDNIKYIFEAIRKKK
ncbi:hypothetical protein [Thalassotalea sp. PS06]|uniref:hypothetical protein n=1 Tax=Thalassotalea sp. PS06 TaxID=2594005 RepID=UPI001163F6A1|nr:hypothetical protein [Thalassotalea sp. PS06]QDP00694.1 hypothetical protein FNC98_04605 [Thalassotalea sp. PS06]